MLYGTDLNSAFSFNLDDTTSMNKGGAAPFGLKLAEPVEKKEKGKPLSLDPPPKVPVPSATNGQPSEFMISQGAKINILSDELEKQRMYYEQKYSTGYIDKLMSKKKEVYKFLSFALIVLLALSVHYMIKHYYKVYFEANVLSPTKDFLMRVVYPVSVLVVMWNIRTFI
jgi:hypothetical protein